MEPDVDLQMTDAPAAPRERHRSLRRAAYLTTGLGIAHAALYILAYVLLTSLPGPRASDADITAFYTSADRRRLTLVGLYVMPFAGIAFLWFSVSLRMWIAGSVRKVNQLFSNVQLMSGILYIGLFFTASAAEVVSVMSAELAGAELDPVVARQLPLLGSTLLIVFAMRMAAMFVFTTSSIGRTSGVLPKWFVFLGYAVGLFLLLSASLSSVLALVFPAWLLVLCVILLWRARQIPAQATIGDRDVSQVVTT
jgi:hypothetical protein